MNKLFLSAAIMAFTSLGSIQSASAMEAEAMVTPTSCEEKCQDGKHKERCLKHCNKCVERKTKKGEDTSKCFHHKKGKRHGKHHENKMATPHHDATTASTTETQ